MRVHAAALTVMLLVAGAAHADPPPGTRAQAKVEFEAARAAFDAGRYAEALAGFQRAYTLAPFPDLLFDIGQCHERLGDRAAAVDAYDRYLAVTPPSGERDELTRHVVALRAELLGATPPSMRVRPRAPIYRRWWLWTTLGVAIGAAVGIGVGVGVGASSPGASTTFPPLRASP